MNDWQPFPVGTRVKHYTQGYEGWIDYPPLTQTHNANEANPDGKSLYRVRLNGRPRRELAAHHGLQPCRDVERIFCSFSSLISTTIERAGHDKKENDRLRTWNEIVPLPYTLWALNVYDPSNGGDPIKSLKDVTRSEEDTRYAVKEFFVKLDNILAPGIPVAIVPSHVAGECNPKILALAQMLAKHARIDATSSLERHQTTDSSRLLRQSRIPVNGIRCHLDSMRVNDSVPVLGQVVLLLDDVLTTGATFMACRKVLLNAGAAEVVCLALGKTKTRTSGRR